MALTLKALALLTVLVTVAILILFRVDESRPFTVVPVGTARGVFVARIVYQSSIAALFQHLTRGQLYAITFWNRVYVASNYLTPTNIRHEVEHVRQWHRYGPIGFPVRYVLELFRFGYLKHPLEIAAREHAGQVPWIR